MSVYNRLPDVRAGPGVVQEQLRLSGKLQRVRNVLKTLDHASGHFQLLAVGEPVTGAAHFPGEPVAVEPGTLVPVGEAGDERAWGRFDKNLVQIVNWRIY